MKYALYVQDPIGYDHLIAEYNDDKKTEGILYAWIKLSKDWKQWQLDFPKYCNLLWNRYETNNKYMPEIKECYVHHNRPYGRGIRGMSRFEWEEIYDHSW